MLYTTISRQYIYIYIYIYIKYILYKQILQDIIFNDTFQILISQILYQYTKLHINATLGIKINTQLNFTNTNTH